MGVIMVILAGGHLSPGNQPGARATLKAGMGSATLVRVWGQGKAHPGGTARLITPLMKEEGVW